MGEQNVELQASPTFFSKTGADKSQRDSLEASPQINICK
jgi:hypothetical protein